MDCALCAEPAEEIEVGIDDSERKIWVAVCDICLRSATDDSYMLTSLFQSKFDLPVLH